MTATDTTPAALGTEAAPAARYVPIQTRSERPHSFDPADFGTPTGREVNWKLSDVKRLAPLFVDEETEVGDDNGIEYGVEALVERGLLVESTGHDAAVRGEIFRPEDVVSAIAWKRSANALHIRLPEGQELAEPAIVRLRGKGADRHANAHIVVEAMPGSIGTVVLQHSGSAQYAQNLEVIVRDGARLTLISVQDWDDDAIHASAHQAVVGDGAYLKHMVVSFGGGVARVNPSMRLAGHRAEGEMYGLSFADSGQHIESQVFMFHEGPETRGDVLYKGALQGTGARSVWVGDVLIGRNATGTDSYEKNQNLVLTDGARADSIPNLEIQTGDIAGAGHASATGRFDDEQLFYLESRGIEEEEARRLVVIGFLMEIVQKIGVPEIEQRLAEAIEEELRRGAGLAPATKAGA